MAAYVIKEVSTLNADREPTCTVNGSLTSAKRAASRAQAFQGTVLRVEDTRGRLVSYKRDGVWTDTGADLA